MSDIPKILLACALVVLLATIGFAYVRSSANFNLAADTTDQGGGKASSASYTIQPGAAGQSTPTGTSGSTNYLLGGGYVYTDSSTLSGDSQGPTVEVTSPIGGELWKGGDTHNITFTATDEGGLKANSLYAWYSTDGGSTYPNQITREAEITSPFVWNIPASINFQTVRVRLNIWDVYNNIGTGESPASFTIDSTPPTVTVISPSGGEKWQGGMDHNLTWSATDNFTLEANPITLQYSINSGVDYTTIVTGEVNGGFFSWPTPSLNTNEARVKILAQDVCGNVGSGEGGNFIIDIDPPTAPVLLTPPNGSTTSDATTTFTWNAATDNLSGIASYEVIIDTDVVTIDATTSYTTSDALAEGLHTWRVKAKDGAGIWGDYSNTWTFTLDLTSPEVAGITLKDRTNGSTQYTNELAISVEANGVTGAPTDMRLAQDAAFTENATAWLAYSAQTEYILTAGEGSRTVYYKVRNAASNESAAVTQSITVDATNPTVTLGQPRGGVTLEAGSSYNITWEAADDYELKATPVTLYFSSNAGSSWSTIQAGIPYGTGEGTYSWTIADVNSSQCRVSIEVEDKAGNKAYDISPANFTISNVQPTAAVLYPNGGEYLKGNTSYNITWAATGEVEPVTINLRYSTNSGTSWTLIASNEVNDGTYAWTTPLIDSTTCRVSIEATDGLSRVATDQSNADFAIDSTTPEVTVVAPNGGERIAGGSSFNIQWTATDAVGFPINAITLRYSTDSGVNWTPIAAAQPNTPPYSWTVPSVNSTTCRVSVEATDYVGNADSAMSASDFTIDSTTPVVNTITPTDGATSVPVDTQVIIVFSKEMSREVTENAFSLTASPPVAGGFGWSTDGKTLTFTPSAALEYNTLYTVGIAVTATDLAGNHLAVFSSTFTTAQRGDTEAPHIIIQRVDSQGVANTLKDGDYIPKQPRFKGEITDNLGVSRATIKFYLDEVEVSATITEISATKFEISYTVTSNLEGETVRTHTVKLSATDIAANSTTREVKDLKVSYESARVMGPVLTYPTTYNPLSGTPARIAYNLTADQDIMIYLFDISGQNVWTEKYLSGAEGGKAGYNEVMFYGRSEISGSYLGNGIYVYKLVAGGKIIGTGRMAIF